MSEDPKSLYVVGVTDSPKIMSGFGQVAASIFPTLNERFDFVAFGFMDHEPDLFGDLGYKFYPTQLLDPMGEEMFPLFVYSQKPDVVFAIGDPGRINRIAVKINALNLEKKPRLVAYTPIEGNPLARHFGEGFDIIKNELRGEVITYSPYSLEVLKQNFPLIEGLDTISWAYHGNDHAPFRKYPDDVRNHLRKLVGLEDLFIVGAGGVNKRTKGFDTLIYTAKYLKSIGADDGIKFYFHTEPENPTLQGYMLRSMAEVHEVEDMILFKPDSNKETRGHMYRGIQREEKATLEELLAMDKAPDNFEARAQLFARFDFISRINMMDMYMDASQVEGWGLWPMEAMACGVPTACMQDAQIRSEIHIPAGAYPVQPIDEDGWTTWNTIAKLPVLSYRDVARTILYFRDNPDVREFYSKRGMEGTSKYKWKDCANKIADVIEDVASRFYPEDEVIIHE